MDPDRLAELHRQRAIVRDHLAWLENEIAAAGGAPRDVHALGAAPSGPPKPPEPRGSADVADRPAVSAALPLEIAVGSHPSNPAAAADSARRGCLFAAFVLILVGAIALTAIYFVRYRDHPLIFMHRDAAPASRK